MHIAPRAAYGGRERLTLLSGLPHAPLTNTGRDAERAVYTPAMTLQLPYLRHDQRFTGLAATLALHLLVLASWYLNKSTVDTVDEDQETIQWVNIEPTRRVEPTPEAPKPHERAAPAPAPPRKAAAAVPKPALAVTEPDAVAPPAPEAPAAPLAQPAQDTPSVDDMLQRARKDIGKIDKDLRKEFPGARIKAPKDSPQLRLARGIEHAAEMAPPKWYEPAKVKEIIDPGPYGRRRYRVVTAFGTYCTTYESNRSPDGRDVMQKGPTPKHTNCPEHEQPATTQKYED